MPPNISDKNNTSPVHIWFQNLINIAIEKKASDIHIEPFINEFSIRLRIDGLLHALPIPAQNILSTIIAHIKILAHLDITKKRLPQDGRITFTYNDRKMDLRIAILPTQYGESITIRLLDSTHFDFSIENLGMDNETVNFMKKIACMANGLFIVTGPTGSGKTTTLYSLLSSINHLQKKIITVEDPVEYTLEDLTQVSIDPNIGLDFPKCLRSLLRQDPNVIMIGEIRDTSTAQIAIHAALTGHLVLSSLHTQDSIGAIYRMQHLGIEKNLINETIEGILAQRLVRCLCSECKKVYTPPKNILEALSIQDTQELFTKNGCHHCAYSGFFGRMGLFELFIMQDSIRDLIYHDASPSVIKKEAETQGLVSLQTIAKKMISSGHTSLEEMMHHIELYNT